MAVKPVSTGSVRPTESLTILIDCGSAVSCRGGGWKCTSLYKEICPNIRPKALIHIPFAYLTLNSDYSNIMPEIHSPFAIILIFRWCPANRMASAKKYWIVSQAEIGYPTLY